MEGEREDPARFEGRIADIVKYRRDQQVAKYGEVNRVQAGKVLEVLVSKHWEVSRFGSQSVSESVQHASCVAG